MSVLLKVWNSDVANYLIAEGFTYMLEQINNKQVYVFAVPDEVLAKIQGLFDAKDFFIENTLRF